MNAATAVILVADPVVLPVETRVIVLRCGGQYDPYEVRFNPATYVTQFDPRRFGSRAIGDLDHYIEFHIDDDDALKMRIDWRAQGTSSSYSMTQEHEGRTETDDADLWDYSLNLKTSSKDCASKRGLLHITWCSTPAATS
jgi:hypothetical protein